MGGEMMNGRREMLHMHVTRRGESGPKDGPLNSLRGFAGFLPYPRVATVNFKLLIHHITPHALIDSCCRRAGFKPRKTPQGRWRPPPPLRAELLSCGS